MYATLAYLALSAFAIGVVFGLFIPFDVWEWLYNDPPHDLGESWKFLDPYEQDEVLEGSWNGLGRSWKGPVRPYDWEVDD